MYSNRTDFERVLYLIRETQINIQYGSHLGESLAKQRYLPNGRMNLSLVDSSIRSMMHMFAGDAFNEQREKTKKSKDKAPNKR